MATIFLIAALPSYLIRLKIAGLPSTLLEAMILIAFFIWFFRHSEYKKFFSGGKWREKFIDHRRQSCPYPFSREMIAWLIISFIAVGVSGFSNGALGIWKAYFFEPILVFILVLNVFKSKLENIVWPLAWGALAVSLLAVFQGFTGHLIDNSLWAAEGTRRAVSFFGYPNAVGLYLGPLVLVFVGWLTQRIFDHKERLIFSYKNLFILLTILLSVASIYYAKSEGALLGVVVALFIFGVMASRKTRRAAIACLVLTVALFSIYGPARDYTIKKITLNDFSGQVRRLQWAETWNMLKDGRIFQGAGLANYQASIKPYHQEGFFYNRDNDPEFHRKTVFNEEFRRSYWQPLEIYLYPHNIVFNFWSELGLLGMLIFAWIIIKFFFVGIWNLFGSLPVRQASWKLEIENSEEQKNKYLTIGLLGAMIVVVIHGFVDVPYFKNDLAVLFWLLIALMGLIQLNNKQDGKNL